MLHFSISAVCGLRKRAYSWVQNKRAGPFINFWKIFTPTCTLFWTPPFINFQGILPFISIHSMSFWPSVMNAFKFSQISGECEVDKQTKCSCDCVYFYLYNSFMLLSYVYGRSQTVSSYVNTYLPCFFFLNLN